MFGDSCGASLLRVNNGSELHQKFLPFTEFIGHKVNLLSRFVSRIYLRVYRVRFGQGYGQEVVDMRRKALKACFGSHEAVNVYEQQLSSAILAGVLRHERLLRGAARVL